MVSLIPLALRESIVNEKPFDMSIIAKRIPGRTNEPHGHCHIIIIPNNKLRIALNKNHPQLEFPTPFKSKAEKIPKNPSTKKTIPMNNVNAISPASKCERSIIPRITKTTANIPLNTFELTPFLVKTLTKLITPNIRKKIPIIIVNSNPAINGKSNAMKPITMSTIPRISVNNQNFFNFSKSTLKKFCTFIPPLTILNK